MSAASLGNASFPSPWYERDQSILVGSFSFRFSGAGLGWLLRLFSVAAALDVGGGFDGEVVACA